MPFLELKKVHSTKFSNGFGYVPPKLGSWVHGINPGNGLSATRIFFNIFSIFDDFLETGARRSTPKLIIKYGKNVEKKIPSQVDRLNPLTPHGTSKTWIHQ